MHSILMGTGEFKAAMGPEPVKVQMVNCPLAAASEQFGGGGTVCMTMQRAVEESRELKRACQVSCSIVW
jgi:hypothetical protein